jgi:tetratricopeptide (TPR) repeat protein
VPLRIVLALVGPLALLSVGVLSQATAQTPRTAPGGDTDSLVEQADAARQAGRLDEAERLYREVLKQRPKWATGYAHIGTMAYEQDRFQDCREAFGRFVELDAAAGPAWSFKGLCEFGLQDYASSRASLDRALAVGGLPEATLLPVVLYHQALLRIRAGEFEAALPALTELAAARPETAELRAACGLLLLRRALLPAAVPPAERQLVDSAGGAYCSYLARRTAEARTRFGQLLAAYPEQEHFHYGYGLFLAQQGDPEAASQFRKEIELHPGHLLAQLELGFELLKRGAAGEALAAGQAAVRLAPGLFASHLVLGRALVETGELQGGILELEKAAALGPGVREAFWALASAYARAGRAQDAERARETVRRLDAARREQAETGRQAAKP